MKRPYGGTFSKAEYSADLVWDDPQVERLAQDYMI